MHNDALIEQDVIDAERSYCRKRLMGDGMKEGWRQAESVAGVIKTVWVEDAGRKALGERLCHYLKSAFGIHAAYNAHVCGRVEVTIPKNAYDWLVNHITECRASDHYRRAVLPQAGSDQALCVLHDRLRGLLMNPVTEWKKNWSREDRHPMAEYAVTRHDLLPGEAGSSVSLATIRAMAAEIFVDTSQKLEVKEEGDRVVFRYPLQEHNKRLAEDKQTAENQPSNVITIQQARLLRAQKESKMRG